MFDKLSKRVNTRLNTFVDDIKYLQKSLKKGTNNNTITIIDINIIINSYYRT